MKSLMIVLFLSLLCSMYALSVYEIQYTNESGNDNTYPSKYLNETVSVQGVVTGVRYNMNQHPAFFISDPQGGLWHGIMVNDGTYPVQLGDYIRLSGTVSEYYGMTAIKNVKSLAVISSHYPLPNPIYVTTGQTTSDEAYEGVLVKVSNASCTDRTDTHGQWKVDDGTGDFVVAGGFFSSSAKGGFIPQVGQTFSSIIGIVDYAYGSYRLNPRYYNEITQNAPVLNSHKSWGRIKSIYK